MKIAIPTDDRETTAGHFGRAREFAVFTAENGTVSEPEFRSNEHTHIAGQGHEHGQSHGEGHGHGHSHDFHGPLGDVDVVICGGMGRRALEAIEQLNIEVIYCGPGAIRELAIACAADSLESGEPSCSCGH